MQRSGIRVGFIELPVTPDSTCLIDEPPFRSSFTRGHSLESNLSTDGHLLEVWVVLHHVPNMTVSDGPSEITSQNADPSFARCTENVDVRKRIDSLKTRANVCRTPDH